MRLREFFGISEGAADIENPAESRDEVIRIVTKELPGALDKFKDQTHLDIEKVQLGFNSWGDLIAKIGKMTFTWDALEGKWSRLG